jgi:hypothetical protein
MVGSMEKGHLLCTEHCCTLMRQSIGKWTWSDNRRRAVPDEHLAQSPVRLSVLKFLRIGQLEGD